MAGATINPETSRRFTLLIKRVFSQTNPQERNAMKELKCEYGDCDSALSTVSEIATGVCERHRDLLARRHHYAVVCWNCCSIVLIDEAPVQGGVKLIQDKYIFTKGCRKCTNAKDEEKWINNPSRDDLSEVVLGENETLNFVAGKLEAGKKKAIIHRRVMPTVDPDQEGEDIIAQIKLRDEADQRLQSFLDDLEL